MPEALHRQLARYLGFDPEDVANLNALRPYVSAVLRHIADRFYEVATREPETTGVRGDDIRLLAQHFVARFAKEFKKPVTQISEQAYDRLAGYSWPGNVRELRNAIERAVLQREGECVEADGIVLGRFEQQPWEGDIEHITLPPDGFDFTKLRKLKNHLLCQALERTNNKETQAAKLLNLSRDRLRYRLQKHGLL